MAEVNLKTINDLQACSFYIPAYQRGYRWTEQEVKDLLNDIYEFDKGKYCLQPLTVKKRPDGSFEVVDGQQRLTTIFIFLKIAQKTTGYEPYKIEFETREHSAEFLASLSDYDGAIRDDNIDYYYITRAYATINNWLNDMAAKGAPRFTVLSNMFNKITGSVFFIWNEADDSAKPVEIFTRFNMGKINLSNAELIKAMIFNRDNFGQDAEKEQQELSLAWDRIERGLHRDSFWYFLVNEGSSYKTRIDFIFELLCDGRADYEYKTFYTFFAKYKAAPSKYSFVKDLWRDVEETYERFVEWYDDLNKYHIIGFLVASGTSIKDIVALSKGKKKSEIISSIVVKTKDRVNTGSESDLRNVTYDYSKKYLRALFLLVNIATLVCKNEKQYRFPFDLYKKEGWDIEHIHATADATGEADDSIGNLTLLSAEINRAYKDKPFNDKRQEIISRDKAGQFIPLCTKNVFMKLYTKNISVMDLWEESDKEDYVNAMWEVLDSFWKGEFKK